MENQICKRYLISGKVQGVFYRANTQKQALALGLLGWAKNLPDGRVEVIACGEASKLLSLEKWLAVGPATAKVNDVIVEELPYKDYSTFEIF